MFLRLGLTSFGGPIAHLAYFREEFVARRHWLSERSYAELVALCQFLPGPASSQVGMALGRLRCGYRGALAAWVGFTLPSAVALILFASSVATYGDVLSSGALHGLKVLAVAVVAQAVWAMARSFCTDAVRITIMAATTCFVLAVPFALGQVGAMFIAAIFGLWFFKPVAGDLQDPVPVVQSSREGIGWLMLFVVLLVGLPLLTLMSASQTLAMVEAFYRSGSLVFGGGHVVLPLLQAEIVQSGWVSKETFLAGYGAAQAVPGPLFTFAAFLGASMNQPPTSWSGGLLALLAIYAPSFFLLFGVLPFWDRIRRNARMQAALQGVNAAVVGLLLAALYQPVWTSAILTPEDFGLALVALVALMFWKIPVWLVVVASTALGWLLSVA